MPILGVANRILGSLADEIRNLKSLGGINEDSFAVNPQKRSLSPNKWNQAHSLVTGAMARAAFSCKGDEYDLVALQRTFKADQYSKFTPDLVLWKRTDSKLRLAAALDYESTNSTDSRVVWRNLENFRRFFNATERSPENTPRFWIIVTSAPSLQREPSEWYSWDLRRKKHERRLTNDEKTEMLRNPFAFYSALYQHGFRTHGGFDSLARERESCSIYMANLQFDELRLYLPPDESFIWLV